jgi:hypothetical protein
MGGEGMRSTEIACRLECWRGRREELDAQLDSLRALTMAAPECPLFEAVEDVWEAYTASLRELVGDDAEWLNWYWLECDMGNKPKEVVPGEGAAPIFCDRNLMNLARVIAWGKK